MKRVWKYPLEHDATGRTTIAVPQGGVVRHVGEDRYEWGNGKAIWIEVDPAVETVDRTFAIVATGRPVEEGMTFHGTIQMTNGTVWHIYEVT